MLILRVVLNQGEFCPPGHICQISSDIFDCYKLGAATCIQWIESRDPAKHPTVHRTELHNKDLVQSVNSSVMRRPGRQAQ